MTRLCLIAGNFHEARTWANGHDLDSGTWFYPESIDDLNRYSNFHVLVIGSAGENVPTSYFNRIYSLAKIRGRIGRT